MLQFQSISKNFIYPCQLASLKQCSTTNIGVALTHFIHTGWVKNTMTSTLVFDIAQFFPSLNHQLLSLIFDKVGFDPKVASFFYNYLVGRKTQYFWNNFSSPLFNVNVGVGQRSAFSPILSALYLALILHILEKQLKNLKISVFIFYFVNNGLLVAQNKLLTVSNSFLFCSYHITSSLVKKL